MLFQAYHSSSGACIADRIEVARSFSKRLIGLMGRKTLMKGQGLYFPGCASIHSFFMRFAIDVLFFDEEMKITKKINGLKPWRMALAPIGTRHTLELSSGVLHKFRLSVGDTISLVYPGDEGRGQNGVR
jgi:uncharacterized membrane protein (UPF0127 family)